MAKIICIGSGKGGVGKTFITTSLGISLSKLRKKILFIDFDMSGANLHTALRSPESTYGIVDFLTAECRLKDIIHRSSFANVDYIYGFKTAHLDHELGYLRAAQMIKELRSLNYDFILFDLGPGASRSNLNLMALADQTILITSSELTSIEKTHRFLEQIKDANLSLKKLSLIVNSIRLNEHYHLGYSLCSVGLKKYGQNILTLGHLPFDNAVWQSALLMQNIFAAMPYAEICNEFFRISKQFIDPEPLRAVS